MTPQELKESILWNAIQGKFTIQNQTESVLNDIANVSLTAVSDEDAYFEIPSNWRWARIGEIFDLVNGKAFKPTDWSEQGIPIVRIQNLNDPNAPYNYFLGDIEEKYMLRGGELLFSWSGTPGTSFGAFIWSGGQAVLNQHIFIVYPKINLDYEYVKYALNGELRIFIAKAHGGAGLKHITRKEFDCCFLPIPPIAEQKRIVAKIEELLPLIDRYEQAWSRLEDLNKRFPGDMQKSILQMAIQGRMVEQRPEEGTGEEQYHLIQREKQALIKAGKIKTEKPLPEIAEDEMPFEIPESWKWVRLRNIVFNRGQETPVETFSYIDIGSIDNKHQCLNSTETIIEPEKAPSRARKLVEFGDIIYSTVRPYLHNMCIIDRPFSHKPIASTGFAAMTCYTGVFNKFLFYYLLSPAFDSYANDAENAKGVAYPAINDDRLYRAVIPLPPLAEQKRIVDRLEELLPLCERLKRM